MKLLLTIITLSLICLIIYLLLTKNKKITNKIKDLPPSYFPLPTKVKLNHHHLWSTNLTSLSITKSSLSTFKSINSSRFALTRPRC